MTKRRLYPKRMRGTAGLKVERQCGKFVLVVNFYPDSRPNELTEIRIPADHWDMGCAARQMREAVQDTVKMMQQTLSEMGGKP